MNAVRPRRGLLYVPGNRSRALDKAPTLDPDGFIFDLEDAVLPEAKDAARQTLLERLPELRLGGRERILRVNGKDGPWRRADLEAAARLVAAGALDAVLLPKVESRTELDDCRAELEALGVRPALMAMIETPRGVLSAESICAHPAVSAVVLGTNDLEVDLRVRRVPGRGPLSSALSMVVLAARAHGVDPIDGVYGGIGDLEGLAAECEQGRQYGFSGKSLVHPEQIGPAQAAFGPSEAEVEAAQAVVRGFEAAQAEGQGVAVVNGQMVEALHARAAQRILDIAGTISRRSTEPGG